MCSKKQSLKNLFIIRNDTRILYIHFLFFNKDSVIYFKSEDIVDVSQLKCTFWKVNMFFPNDFRKFGLPRDVRARGEPSVFFTPLPHVKKRRLYVVCCTQCACWERRIQRRVREYNYFPRWFRVADDTRPKRKSTSQSRISTGNNAYARVSCVTCDVCLRIAWTNDKTRVAVVDEIE